jgi:ABC-2 type transport system ATP-binding protein
MAAAVSIRNLIKTYPNGTQALKGVSLDIPEGDFFSLLGPNGAGKTTLIGILSGLTNKSDGDALIFGHSVSTEPEAAKSFIGVVPQEFNFNIFETVENIVLDQAGYYGMPRNKAKSAAEKYLLALGLWEKRNEPSQRLSGGMKRRLMIARALAHEPQLLILDEPTAGVDVELRHGMWDFLRKLNAAGRTIILTTHYLEEAELLSKHIAIINKGEIAEKGSVRELLSKLREETFLLDLDKEALQQDIDALASISARAEKVDGNTIEISLTKEQSLNGIILALNERKLLVKSMRNKTNRLEELFLNITQN